LSPLWSCEIASIRSFLQQGFFTEISKELLWTGGRQTAKRCVHEGGGAYIILQVLCGAVVSWLHMSNAGVNFRRGKLAHFISIVSFGNRRIYLIRFLLLPFIYFFNVFAVI
jgi:hypothetical protein